MDLIKGAGYWLLGSGYWVPNIPSTKHQAPRNKHPETSTQNQAKRQKIC